MSVIKIGSTRHPVHRQSHWRRVCAGLGWNPVDCQNGAILHVEPTSSIDNARHAEKLAHRILRRHQSWPDPSPKQVEWFAAPERLLINMVVLAVHLVECGIQPIPRDQKLYEMASGRMSSR